MPPFVCVRSSILQFEKNVVTRVDTFIDYIKAYQVSLRIIASQIHLLSEMRKVIFE